MKLITLESGRRIEDITGIFARDWEVLRHSRHVGEGRGSRDYWFARCSTCGFIRDFIGQKLKVADVTACGHVYKYLTEVVAPHFMPIPGCDGYAACDDGTVWTRRISGVAGAFHDFWRPLTMRYDKRGYPAVTVYRGHAKETRKVSQLILEAFVGPCPPNMEACHAPDPNPSNNTRGNLRWDTRVGNMDDRRAARLAGISTKQHAGIKLSVAQVREIRSLISDGASPSQVATLYGVTKRYVNLIAAGTRCKGI